MTQTAARGGFLAFIGLVFGVNALRYPIGAFDHPGPGLFPLIVSAVVLLLATVMLVGSRRSSGERLELRSSNITTLLAALGGFVLASHLLDMAAGIVVLVFTAGLAARTPSPKRSAILAVVLIVVALGFERLLGLRLGVF